MTATLTAPTATDIDSPATVLDTDTTATGDSPFLAALGEIENLLATDPDTARERFAAILPLATEAERGFLDRVAALMERSPWKVAARQIGWMAKSRPELRALILDATTDRDPGLYRPEIPREPDTSIEAAEWVRRSIRDRRDHSYRVTARPSAATDTARLRPEAIAARRTRIPAPTVGNVSLRHRRRDLAVQRRREDLWAGYARTRLYGIDTDVDDDDDRTPPVPDPSKPAHLIWAHVQAELWDRSYILHVAGCYTEADRYLLAPETPERRISTSARHDGLDDAATEFLRERDTDTRPQRERRAPRTPRRFPRRLTTADQMRFAARRTGIPIPSDRDIYLPYSELDVPEPTWQGSGLDYDLAAMVPYLGWPCVSCWIDRPATDRRPRHTRDGHTISDDGLCDVCRADGHPGIPPVPAIPAMVVTNAYRTYAYVESRCAHIAATQPGQARALLDRVRAAAANTGPTWRLITRWMAMHLGQPERTPRPATARPPRRGGSALGAGQRIGRCDACARTSVVHADNYCTDCRIALGLVPTRRTGSAAVA
ncbi:hypothetical protein ACWEKT_20640 [Nocardia takedensis]